MSTVEVNLSAAAAAADGVQVLLAGWGMKEGGMFKTWRRRFFVLRNRLPGEHLGDWLGPASASPAAGALDGAKFLLLYYKSTGQASSATKGPTGVFPIGKGTKISVMSRTVRKVEQETLKIETPGVDRAFFVVPEDGTASWINAIANPSQAAVAPGAELRRMTLGSTVRPLAATRANDDAPHTTPSAAGFHPDSKPGLQITVDAAGDGGIVSKPGDTLAMFYTGTIDVSSAAGTPGFQFDSTDGRAQYSFKLGRGQVLKGWDEGLLGMCVGEKRTLVLGPDYGYGMAGAGHQANSEDQTPTPLIPGGATLRFTTELIGINMLVGAAVASAERDALVLVSQIVEQMIVQGGAPRFDQNMCDACYNCHKAQMPIVGPLFSKIKDFGDREKQYDMCGTDFNKLPPAEQAGYYVTLRPGAKPVKYIDTPDGAHVKLHRKFAGVVKGMSGLLSAHTGPDAKKTACEIKVDAGLPWPLRSVMETIGRDPALTKAEKEELAEIIPPFQRSLEELAAVCREVFVTEKRFRIPTTPVERASAMGTHKLDITTLLLGPGGWKSKAATLTDGRSIEGCFLESKRWAKAVLVALDSAVNRAWETAWAVHLNGADTPKVSVEMAVPSLTVPDGTVTQPIPDDRFRDPRFLEQGPMGCDQIGAEIVQLFAKFAQDAYAGMFGLSFFRYQSAYQQAMASGDQDRIVAVVAASSESDKDLSKTLTSIMLGIATTMGFHHGRSLYSLYVSVRARYANLGFPGLVRAALAANIGSDFEADGVDVRTVDLKGDDRRDAKRIEYGKEGLPYPHCSHVKDILRLTLAVHTIALMIICAVAVREGMTVLSVKNRLGSRATRDILMIVQLPCGMLAEVQVHLRAVLAIKKHTHKPYKVDRLEATECPCNGALVDVPQHRIENIAASDIVLVASYTKSK